MRITIIAALLVLVAGSAWAQGMPMMECANGWYAADCTSFGGLAKQKSSKLPYFVKYNYRYPSNGDHQDSTIMQLAGSELDISKIRNRIRKEFPKGSGVDLTIISITPLGCER